MFPPLITALLTSLLVAVDQTTLLVEQFRQADRLGKRRIVADSVLGKTPASNDEIRQLLIVAMKDPEVSVRAEAVGSVGTILTLSSLPTIPPGQDWTAKLRPVAESLRSEIEAATGDSEPRVRREAWRGILGPFLGPFGGATSTLQVPKPVVQKLAATFETDPDIQMKALAMQVVSLSYGSTDPEIQRLATQVLVHALEQSEPYLVQAAGLAATQSRIPEALPLLVKQLKNPSYVARMGVAQGIGAYGAAARSYLPELQSALAAETHDITRKTIAGTISVITK